MPVAGSTAMASCTKRPMAVSGSNVARPSTGTSKIQPCSRVKRGSLTGSAVVSSQVSHEPQGVGPPAQLRMVPAMLAVLRITFAACKSRSSVVVPPPASVSYASEVENGVPVPRSWLRISRMSPFSSGNAAIPSCRFGVGVPSSRGSRVQPNVK